MFLLLFALYLFPCCDRVVRSSVEIREEDEEDGRVKKKKSCYQFWVATVEDQGLRAVYEHQEELHLEMKRNCVSNEHQRYTPHRQDVEHLQQLGGTILPFSVPRSIRS